MKRQISLVSLFAVATVGTNVLPTAASAADVREITVTVERATASQNVDINANPFSSDEKPDLFTTVSVNDRPVRTSQTLNDRLDATFNFAVTEQITSQAPTGLYPIVIKLFDRNKFGGSRDMDIHPGNSRDLVMYYSPFGNGSVSVQGLDARARSFRGGDLIKMTGACSQKFGCGVPSTIYFRVTHR